MRRGLPREAAWRHHTAREGFETVFPVLPVLAGGTEAGRGLVLDGHTAAVEEGVAWTVRYSITVDDRWHTVAARVWRWSVAGESDVSITGDGAGRWTVDGVPVPSLNGCLDVDLESSACTNALPVHRLALAVGRAAEAPAVYVRAVDLAVERLEQSYRRLPDDVGRSRYDYRSPAFDVRCELEYDAFGLVVEYPGIASRVL